MPVVLITLLLLFCGSAVAQQTPPRAPDGAFEGTQIVWPEFEDSAADAPTARIGFVFDPVLRSREASISPGEPIEVLLVAWDIQVALQAWEVKVTIDPRLTVVERKLECDLHLDLDDGDLLAMLKPEHCNRSAEIVLARYKLLLMDGEDANDLVLRVGPITKPTKIDVESDAPWPAPVYRICRQDGDTRPFLFSPVSAVLNPVEVHPDPIDGEAPKFAPARLRN